MKLLGKQSSDL